MDTQAMGIITAHLVRLAAAHRLTLTTETIDIYQEDLMEFTQEQVLTAIAWARQNMTRFPTIADLRIQIEGSDEDHANKAWDALIKMLYTEISSSLTIMDLVLVQTIEQTWTTWPETRRFFLRLPDEMTKQAAKRAFRIAYIEHYKHRRELATTMTCPTILEGKIPDNADNYAYIQEDYLLDSSYNLMLLSRRQVPPRLPQTRVPMTPELQALHDRFLANFGKGRPPVTSTNLADLDLGHATPNPDRLPLGGRLGDAAHELEELR